jgi:hypothetical protein
MELAVARTLRRDQTVGVPNKCQTGGLRAAAVVLKEGPQSRPTGGLWVCQ